MKILMLKREKDITTNITTSSIEEVKNILSEYGPNVRYTIQAGQQIICVFSCSDNKFQVVHYDLEDDVCNELVVRDEEKSIAYCEVDYDTMINEVSHFLEHNNYRWGSEWHPVDTGKLLDISADEFENLLKKEEAIYNRQKTFSTKICR